MMVNHNLNFLFNVIFLALAIFDAMVLLCVILVKGWPNIVESVWNDFHIKIFLVFHPLLSLSMLMGIYLTIMMTLERYAAVCWKRTKNDIKKTKLLVILLFFVCSIYILPKCLEYTFKSRYIRKEYDLQESNWSNVVPLDLQIDYSLKTKGSLKFLQENQWILDAETSHSDCKSGNSKDEIF